MTILAQEVSLSRPCPVDLDDQFAKSQAKRQYCGHCRENVHMLSAMTEREAKRFLASSEGKNICISYNLNREGDVEFRPEPVVPLSRLRRAPKRLKRLAAVGVTAALAACTPHGTPEGLESQPDVEIQIQSSGPMIPASKKEMVVGKMEAEPVEDIEETPCEPEAETPKVEPIPEIKSTRRGRRVKRGARKPVRKPIKPDDTEMMVGFI